MQPKRKTDSWPQWPLAIAEIETQLNSVLERRRWALSGCWTGTKPKEQEFGERFAAWNGVRFCVPVDHGSSALVIALEALDIGVGDEVIVPALTWVATATAVLSVGATPVFADVDHDSCCISPVAVEAAITPRTKAIIPVHLHCTMARMDRIMALAATNRLSVIEDCAQSHGAIWRGRRAGSIGHLGCFSMQQSKVLCAGEGGAVITDDAGLYERLQQLRADSRSYSVAEPMLHEMQLIERGDVMGTNYCLSEFNAAVLLAQLPHLNEQNAVRAANAGYLDEELSALGGLTPITQPAGLERRSIYEYAVRYCAAAFGGRPAEDFCNALTNALGFAVYQTDLPLPQNPLYCPWTKRRFAAIHHPHAQPEVRQINFPEAMAAHRELIVFHHSILLGNAAQMDRIVEAFQQAQEQFRSVPAA